MVWLIAQGGIGIRVNPRLVEVIEELPGGQTLVVLSSGRCYIVQGEAEEIQRLLEYKLGGGR